MKNKETLQQFKKQLDHAEYYNNLAPFPVYDTEYVQKLKEKMNEVKDSNTDYDELPVEACKSCKNLYLVDDKLGNTICMKCNTMNEVVEYKNIHEYKKVKSIWND